MLRVYAQLFLGKADNRFHFGKLGNFNVGHIGS